MVFVVLDLVVSIYIIAREDGTKSLLGNVSHERQVTGTLTAELATLAASSWVRAAHLSAFECVFRLADKLAFSEADAMDSRRFEG